MQSRRRLHENDEHHPIPRRRGSLRPRRQLPAAVIGTFGAVGAEIIGEIANTGKVQRAHFWAYFHDPYLADHLTQIKQLQAVYELPLMTKLNDLGFHAVRGDATKLALEGYVTCALDK